MVEFDLMGYSVLVDNEDQARKLQEYAFKQGFEWNSGCKEVLYLGCKSFQFGIFGFKKITKTEGGEHYQDEDITKKAHYHDIFGETKEEVYLDLKGKELLIGDFITNETIEEKVKRLEKELQQAKQELEESKPKVGGIAVVDNGEYKAIVVLNRHQVNIFEDAVVLPKELQEQLRPYFETDTFVLPKKWCLKSDDILFVEYCNKNGIFKDSYTPKELKGNYAHFPAINDLYTTYDTIYYGYTEITLEQFKKYVLNK